MGRLAWSQLRFRDARSALEARAGTVQPNFLSTIRRVASHVRRLRVTGLVAAIVLAAVALAAPLAHAATGPDNTNDDAHECLLNFNKMCWDVKDGNLRPGQQVYLYNKHQAQADGWATVYDVVQSNWPFTIQRLDHKFQGDKVFQRTGLSLHLVPEQRVTAACLPGDRLLPVGAATVLQPVTALRAVRQSRQRALTPRSATGSGRRPCGRGRTGAAGVPRWRTGPARTGSGCGTGSRTAG